MNKRAELDSKIRSTRTALKIKLWNIRMNQNVVICAICGNHVRADDCDLHEVFYTKGDVMNAEESAIIKINSPENCVFLHRACHEKATSFDNRVKCAAFLIVHEGYDKIFNWIVEMNNEMPRLVNITVSEKVYILDTARKLLCQCIKNSGAKQ